MRPLAAGRSMVALVGAALVVRLRKEGWESLAAAAVAPGQGGLGTTAVVGQTVVVVALLAGEKTERRSTILVVAVEPQSVICWVRWSKPIPPGVRQRPVDLRPHRYLSALAVAAVVATRHHRVRVLAEREHSPVGAAAEEAQRSQVKQQAQAVQGAVALSS